MFSFVSASFFKRMPTSAILPLVLGPSGWPLSCCYIDCCNIALEAWVQEKCLTRDLDHDVAHTRHTGVKVLLAGEQQAAVTVAVEGLMDSKPMPELDSYCTFDPRVRMVMPHTPSG
jgi:hypothetical protein